MPEESWSKNILSWFSWFLATSLSVSSYLITHLRVLGLLKVPSLEERTTHLKPKHCSIYTDPGTMAVLALPSVFMYLVGDF